MNTTRQAKAPINADRFNAILAETTPLAAVLGIRAERNRSRCGLVPHHLQRGCSAAGRHV